MISGLVEELAGPDEARCPCFGLDRPHLSWKIGRRKKSVVHLEIVLGATPGHRHALRGLMDPEGRNRALDTHRVPCEPEPQDELEIPAVETLEWTAELSARQQRARALGIDPVGAGSSHLDGVEVFGDEATSPRSRLHVGVNRITVGEQGLRIRFQRLDHESATDPGNSVSSELSQPRIGALERENAPFSAAA